MRNRLLSYAGILASFFACANRDGSHVPRENLPNIILIMADDLGFGDIACYGNETIRTPHLDKLASKGAIFLDYHSNGVVCSPTRAALLTGKYQQRSGIEGVVTAKNHRHLGLPAKKTLASYLQACNYRTGIVGKWHLGYDTLFSPINRGFDYFKGFVSGNIDYHSHIDQEGYYDWWLGKDTLVETGYGTDLITRSSIDFIARNKNRRFFLYVAHEAPHYPYQGREDSADRSLRGQFNKHGSRTDKKAAYKEMIEIMDEGIGSLLKYLESEDLIEHTLIFFLSDNGANEVGSNGPLRGYKGNVWEGGHRVPAIAYWKNTISPKLIDQTIMSMDIFPTVLDVLGDRSLETSTFDGRSFFPLLLERDAAFESRTLFWRYGETKKAVRSGNWKYIQFNDHEYLFDLDKDLGELHNLMDSLPAVADRLQSGLAEWEDEMSAYERITN